jgi:chromosome segregation ATPase
MGGFMSLTETLMLVVLGFALALLVVLLFGRGFWAIATSFGAKRKAKNIPVEMLELQADRDRLRAEHAIMSRKLELRLEEIKACMTEQLAEVSRSRNRVQTLAEQLETSEAAVASRDSEIVGLKAQVEAYQSEIETMQTSLKSLTSENNQKNSEIGKLSKSVSQLTTNLREKNSIATQLDEESNSKLRKRIAAIAEPREIDVSDDRLKKRISELSLISAEMDEAQRGDAQTSKATLTYNVPVETSEFETALDYKFDDAEREADSLNRELKAIDEALERKRSTPYPAPTPVKSSAKANIISLTQRIRALQSDKN